MTGISLIRPESLVVCRKLLCLNKSVRRKKKWTPTVNEMFSELTTDLTYECRSPEPRIFQDLVKVFKYRTTHGWHGTVQKNLCRKEGVSCLVSSLALRTQASINDPAHRRFADLAEAIESLEFRPNTSLVM